MTSADNLAADVSYDILAVEWLFVDIDKKDTLEPNTLNGVIKEKYFPLVANPDHVIVLAPGEIDTLVKQCVDTALDKDFLEASYQDIEAYRNVQLGKKEE